MILILGCVLFPAPWLIKNPCLCVQGFFDRIPKDPAMAAAVMLILYCYNVNNRVKHASQACFSRTHA